MIYVIQGYIIRGVREQKRLTQEAFARVMGVSVTTISRWERETSVLLPVCIQLLAKVAGFNCLKLPDAVDQHFRNLQKDAATAVKVAIVKGDLHRPEVDECVDCGGAATYYDHRDYLKPLEVDPVCITCNARRGRALNTFFHHLDYWSKFEWPYIPVATIRYAEPVRTKRLNSITKGMTNWKKKPK